MSPGCRCLVWLALAAASGTAHAQEPKTLQLRAALGVGAHSRSFVRPQGPITTRMPTSYVPAIEGSLGVVVWPETDFSLAIAASYQTGLWMKVTELPPFAPAKDVPVRSQRLALNVAPSWRIGAGTRIGFGLGASLRWLWPDDRALQTPGYFLVGPHARAELVAAIAGPLQLRVTPELQWLVLMQEPATENPYAGQGFTVGGNGAAVGGELALELALGPMRTLALSYRESHAFFQRDGRFQDVERYLTVRIEEAF